MTLPFTIECWGEGWNHEGGGDNVIPWNNAAAHVSANPYKGWKLLLPPNNAGGGMRFLSKPARLPAGIVEGAGSGWTFLRRSYTPDDPYEIFMDYPHDGGGNLSGVTLSADPGTSGGIALGIVSSPTASADFSKGRDININGVYGGLGTWRVGFYPNGIAKFGPLGSGIAPGLRDLHFDEMVIGQCTEYVMMAYAVKSGYIDHFISIPCGAAPSKMLMDGSKTHGVTCDQFRISGPQVPEIIHMDNCIDCSIAANGVGGNGADILVSMGADCGDCEVELKGAGGANPTVKLNPAGPRNRVKIAGDEWYSDRLPTVHYPSP